MEVGETEVHTSVDKIARNTRINAESLVNEESKIDRAGGVRSLVPIETSQQSMS